jgi:hypothetical protein
LATNFLTEAKEPWRMALPVMIEKKRSTWFSEEEEL